MNRTEAQPLVKGGQGRSDHEVTQTGKASGWMLVVAGLMSLCYCLLR